MKRTALLAAAAIMAISSCQENNNYTINGTIADVADGQYVYLLNTDQKATVLDSALVKDGKFQFKGVTETEIFPKTLMYQAENTRMGILLFLEKGKIKADLMKDNSSAGGTQNNDALYAFLDHYRGLEMEKQNLYRNIYTASATASDAEMEKMWNEFDQKEVEQQEYIFGQISENIDQPFGMYLLASFGMQFEAERLHELLPRIPAQLAENEAIRQMTSYVEHRMNTAVGKKRS